MKKDKNIITDYDEHEVRIHKAETLKNKGIDPWRSLKKINSNCHQVITEFQEEKEKNYNIAGRLMTLRMHGKTAFGNIQDRTGKIQIYFKQDILGKDQFEFLKNFIDVGDILWLHGYSFKTKTGEITLKVEEFTLLSKCLRPLPEKFHGLVDVETRYRQRYLDLISNKESREKFIIRSKIINCLRSYLNEHDFLEVETPMLHPIPGGAAARPFITHYNALNDDFYLRIAPELYLKRLVIGGFERVYEINRNFRNEGISTRHNPEFTMAEFYIAYQDYYYMMNFIEDMIRNIVKKTIGALKITYNNSILDFASPFEKISMKNAIVKYGNVKEKSITPQNIDKILIEKGIELENSNFSFGKKIEALFEELVEDKLIKPTFIVDYPIEISPLARKDENNPNVAARFELFIGGMEISNGFNELNNPFEQALRFREQVKERSDGDKEAHLFDSDYILALEYAMPPTVGAGIGIDRLVMILTNTKSIRDVILFPTLKKRVD